MKGCFHFALAKVTLMLSFQNLSMADCSRVFTFEKFRVKKASFNALCSDSGNNPQFYLLKLCFQGVMGTLHNSLSIKIIRNACFIFDIPLRAKLLKCFTNIFGPISHLQESSWSCLPKIIKPRLTDCLLSFSEEGGLWDPYLSIQLSRPTNCIYHSALISCNVGVSDRG